MYPKLRLFLPLFTLTVMGMLCFRVSGQDLHFSQFSHAPNLLGPTETGNYFGDWRFAHSYRNQWNQIGKPMTTVALAYDRQIYLWNQKLSIGGVYAYDESGNHLLIQQKFLIGATYHQHIGRHTFRIGVQGGVGQKRFYGGGLSFPDQWDPNAGFFNRLLPSSEMNLSRIFYYPDLNAGIGYARYFGKLRPDIGYAVFHLNKPSETFLGDADNTLNRRHVLYARTPVPLKGKWSLEPQLLWMRQNKANDLIAMTYVYYELGQNAAKAKQVFAGLSTRNMATRNWDAVIFAGGLQFRHLRTAVSYDVTVSKLRLANSFRGAFEFALIYTGGSSVLRKRTFPCQRV